jgi:eukaryotic translation initiation factor 2C
MGNPSWNLLNRKFLTTSKNAKWKGFIIAVPHGDRETSVLKNESLLKEMWTGFTKVIQSTYSTTSCERVGHIISPGFGQSLEAAKAIMEQARKKRADFVMLFLEKRSAPGYAYFKTLADCTYGMHSVCVTYDAKRGFTPQYWANIAMKINLKAGGLNHTVDGVEAGMSNTLVLGA